MSKYVLTYDEKKKMKINFKKTLIYLLLIILGWTFVMPIIESMLLSLFSASDISNQLITYVPQNPTFDNYQDIFSRISFFKILFFSIIYAGGSSILQVISTSIVGYGLAKYNFWGKKLILILIIIFFLIPSTVVMIQNYVIMGQLHLTNTLFAFYFPALLAQGINSSIFILLFYGFFSRIPNELYESAQMEGANAFVVFSKIIVPLVKGAIIITFVLSFVWYWNDGTIAPQYYRNIPTVNETIILTQNTLEAAETNQLEKLPIYDGLKGASLMIIVTPLIIFYFVVQKSFRKSTEGSGLTGQ